MLKLRPYQQNAVANIRASYISGAVAPLFVLPTGGGKTVLFTHIAQSASAKNTKVLILVHRVELLRQTSKTLRSFGVRHGLINPNYTPDYTAPVQVASVQTIVNRLQKIPISFGLIIVDEAHHATASTWRKTISNYSRAKVLGVTATPCRGDGKGLGKNVGGLFDDMVLGPSASDLMSMGFLVRPTIFAPPNRIDLSAIKTTAGDYNKKGLAEATDKPMITGDAVAHYRKLCHNVPAVAFCVSVAHAEHVAEAFRANGYKAEAVDGKMDDDSRSRILAGLGNGSIHVVTSCDLIGEGVDIPAIGCAILLRPTQSKGLYLQQVGRALRVLEGKTSAIILDHVGNVIAHGMPDGDQEWSLDGEVKKKGKRKDEPTLQVKECPTCFCAHEPAPKCPNCGHIYETKGRELQTEDGELVAMTAEMIEAIKLKKRRERKSEEAQAQTLEQLRALAKERGYKPSWAEHRYKARQNKRWGL